jgi:hypothetical protein
MSGTRHYTTDDAISSMRLNGNLTIERFRKRLPSIEAWQSPGHKPIQFASWKQQNQQ